MTFRYNPQSIEKQVRQWPVLFSETDLHKDIILRVNQLWSDNSANKSGLINPFSCTLPFDKEIISEYGTDACRLAAINSGNQSPELLLEPSFKWLARLHDTICMNSDKSFNPVPWIEAIIQAKDHIICRNSDRLALALAMKAFKEASPDSSLTANEISLVAAAIFPFAPVYAIARLFPENNVPSIKTIIDSFSDFYCARIALENGGWHWHVFARKAFLSTPEEELLKLKWVKKAISGHKIKLIKEDEGIRICLA